MAKKKKTDPKQDAKAHTLARIKRTEAYAERVRSLFAATVNEILALNKTMPTLADGEMFSFDAQSEKKQQEVERLLRQLHSVATMAIQQGVRLEWAQANAECDKLVRSCLGRQALNTPQMQAVMTRNAAAQAAFISRSENGLNLSQRVWKATRQLRDEMEVAITCAIGEGKSASSMSRDVRQYLNDPDLMFRRFRYKIGEEDVLDDDGNVIGKKPVFGKKWKKRIRKPDGTVGWIDYDKDSYRDEWTGPGYYKSSAQNAMRVARTETNIAYRRADQQRWSQMDFVLGQRVQMSASHPKKDICDKLQGDYPKDFVFDGWHPQCFCFVTPILADEEEINKKVEAMLRGEDYTLRSKQITDYPEGFKQWVRDNAQKLSDAHAGGRDPYFVRNNYNVVQNIIDPPKELTVKERADLRHAARTEEQKEAIRLRWQERQERIEGERKFKARVNTTANNVLNVANTRFADFGFDTTALNTAIQSGDTALIQSETRALAQQLAQKQKQVKTTASNVLNVAQKYKDISASDMTALQDLMKTGNVSAINASTRALANEVKSVLQRASILNDVIPNAKQWTEDFTIAELESAHTAIKNKIASFAHLPIADQIKKLEFEAQYVADPTYGKAHKLHSTWKVAQSAYTEALAKAYHQQKVEQCNIKLSALKTYLAAHPKATTLATLIAQAESALASNDPNLALSHIADAELKQKQLEAAQVRRDAKKAQKAAKDREVIDVNHSKSCFTEDRRNNAKWHIHEDDANDYFIDNGRTAWNAASDEERTSIHRYTVGSAYCTETLRSINNHTGNWWYLENSSHTVAQTQADIDNITNYIGNNTFAHDVWLKRDDCTWCLNYVFNIDLQAILNDIDARKQKLRKDYEKKFGRDFMLDNTIKTQFEGECESYAQQKMNALVGKIGCDSSFVSCGSNKNTYFDGTRPPKDVVMNIYCPKGTCGVYAEPFNYYGQYKRGWNGKDKPTFLNENEVILQRCTSYRITKVQRGYCAGLGRMVWFIDVDVIAQTPRPVTVVSEGGRLHV